MRIATVLVILAVLPLSAAALAQREPGVGPSPQLPEPQHSLLPTINVALPNPRKLLPPQGVYAVRVQTPGGAHGGMLNLGPRPTFGDSAVSIEAHLFDTSGDWYGAWVRVDFIARLRDTRRFESAEALIEQLRRDEHAARNALETTH